MKNEVALAALEYAMHMYDNYCSECYVLVKRERLLSVGKKWTKEAIAIFALVIRDETSCRISLARAMAT